MASAEHSSSATSPEQQEARRGAFSSRKVFILAAIGSAVGLGNIWRFPYVAYENGGGAFVIPYLVALLTAGLPFLFLDYAIGHKHRGSAPLSMARESRKAEPLGWWQVGICFVIAVYYAVIIAYAARYTFFSIDKAWGSDPEGFFFGEFLQTSDPGVTLDFVAGVLIALLIVWAAVLLIMGLGVQKGIGATSVVFIPLLVLAFGFLVVRALFLPGAGEGLDTLFSPNWDALRDTSVWAAAFGQIFFSLSIGFGIMITYASYVGRRTDMTGSGLVVGFANSSFELLAGIGVFAALGFMAQAGGVAVDEVVADGIGLAFVAFPAIISQAAGGSLIGVLFFGSLVIAGLTSLVSVLEVVVSAVRDKFDLNRVTAVLVVGVPAMVVSVVLFATTSGLLVLDIVDYFVNQFGILLVAVVTMIVMGLGLRALPGLAAHLNRYGSVKLGRTWMALVAVIAPLALGYVLVRAFIDTLDEPYGGYPAWMLNVFGWGTAGLLIVVAIVVTFARRKPVTPAHDDREEVGR
ncbi:MAG: sodium-dependent transporter [Aeromicrobium sp.]|uniref:sodium-dependent transporter n=1 Tax=Aeromicrobium sp. TaxID=1871063 RepID=UPI0026186965|nr:sodium-dependent transporter [Aeromicrobium sp.]MDF1703518.1 sodium-dependent transporter [Aeromicrobium sp.]